MRAQLRQSAGESVLYDADLLPEPPLELFDPQQLRQQGKVTGEAQGRGTLVFFDHDSRSLALRHYRRGGHIATLMNDRYVWAGLEKTRSFREWRLLRKLHERGLPVPRPVAARAVRAGLHYRADLITQRLEDTRSLARALMDGSLPESTWNAIGQCLRRFHEAGACHADLNAHNILLGVRGEVYLIDFDKGRLRTPARAWQERNLQRLHRSLDKLLSQHAGFGFSEPHFGRLVEGYRG